MVINTAVAFAMAAVCLAGIAAAPAARAQAQRHTVTVKHAPIGNPVDVSEPRSAQQNVLDEQTIRAAAADKTRFPSSADEKGMRPDHRSAAPPKLCRQLRVIR